MSHFEDWWNSHGQYCRSGGGAYEKTFAYRAWQAAIDLCLALCEERMRREHDKAANTSNEIARNVYTTHVETVELVANEIRHFRE